MDFLPNAGPWAPFNASSVRLTPSATIGSVNISASGDAFTSNDVGALIELTQSGQNVETSATAADVATDSVLISGADPASRTFTFSISGTWAGTVWLERSYGTPDGFTNWSAYTTNVSTTRNDGNRADLLYVRLRVEAYTSGTVEMNVRYDGGQTVTVARIVSVTDSQNASVETLGKPFGEANQAT